MNLEETTAIHVDWADVSHRVDWSALSRSNANIECGFAKHCIPNPDMNAAAREWNKMISERNYLYNHPNDGVLKTKCMIENTPVVHEEFVNFLGGE